MNDLIAQSRRQPPRCKKALSQYTTIVVRPIPSVSQGPVPSPEGSGLAKEIKGIHIRHQTLVTDQTSIQNLASGICSRSSLGTSTRIAHTLTSPFLNTSFSHNSLQLSEEWHHIRRPVGLTFVASARQPFSGSPPWAPKMTEPGSGERREARRCASISCFSSLKRWKNEAAKMAERRPWSGVRLVREESGGRRLVGAVVNGGASEMKLGSNASPGMNVAGKDSGVVR